LGLSGYLYKFDEADHKRLRDLLGSIKGKFLLSINDHPLIREWYAPFDMESVETRYSIAKQTKGRRPVGELLIMNYNRTTESEDER